MAFRNELTADDAAQAAGTFPLVEDPAVVHTANANYGPLFVGDWLSVQGQLSVGGQPQQLTFQWFTDSKASRGLGAETIVMDAPGQANFALSNRGPWLTVGVANRNPALAGNYGLRVLTSPRPARGVFALAPTFVIAQAAVALPAHNAITFREVAKWAGPVGVYVETDATLWDLALECEDLAGNVHRWGDLSNASGPGKQQLAAVVPPEIVRATFTNNDGVARTFSLFIVPDSAVV